MAERKPSRQIIMIDPELSYRRQLHYQERHSGWHIFRGIFWAIYLFMMGIFLITLVPQSLSIEGFFGWALVLLSLFVIVYGFSSSLHLKLMRRYA